jgi:hypothetical protein
MQIQSALHKIHFALNQWQIPEKSPGLFLVLFVLTMYNLFMKGKEFIWFGQLDFQ